MKRMLPVLILFILSATLPVWTQTIPSPEDEFGFPVGADRRLLNWEQIVSYFRMLDERSPRVQVVELGPTTLNRPMIMAIISGEETMQNLEHYRRLQEQLARPFDLAGEEAEPLLRESKAVVLITMNIHSTEIASSQEAVELAYELATGNDPRTQKILHRVILLMVPSLNPDGQDMVTRWYLEHVGTPHEGSPMPYKYHHYADHDNNRDWFFFNLVESRHVAKVLYHRWYPEIVMDQHQMGSRGARFFLPPYSDPVNPNVPPSLMANLNMVGKHIVADLHDRGFAGVVTGTIFNAYFEGTMSKTPLWHNRIGILTEAASVRLATPLYFPRTSLRGMGLDLPEYKQQTNFLNPWPGGWWRLRDIVEYQKAAALALLELAADYKLRFKRNFYQLNRRAIVGDWPEHPTAYILPLDQHDPGNAVELLRRLRFANVEVYQAQADFTADGHRFSKGDFIIPLAQPARGYIKDLMERQHYPDLREYPGGPPRRPYDVTAWTLPLQMGVEAVAVYDRINAPVQRVEEPTLPVATDALHEGAIAIERRHTGGFGLVNALLKEKFPVYELRQEAGAYPAGTFVVKVEAKQLETVRELVKRWEVPVVNLPEAESLPLGPVRPARIGIYQPWIPYVYDEGWLRLILDRFGFSYTVLHNDDLRKGKPLSDRVDVLIFGSQSSNRIVNGRAQSSTVGEPQIPREFLGGIGSEGVRRVQEFLEEGGTVLFFGEACNFAIEKLHLPAANPLREVQRKAFFIPGSLLEVRLDTGSPLTRGLPDRAAIYVNHNVVLTLQPYPREIGEIGVYGDRDLLLSGWAVGEEKLYGKVALAEIPVEKGRAVLYAFRPQHRGQTYGTFKLIFNALYLER